LTELLVVIAVVALVFCFQLPVLARAKAQTAMAQCANNVRRFALTLQLYGNDNNAQLPTLPSGSWAMDFPKSLMNTLNKYGMQWNQYYCPANLRITNTHGGDFASIVAITYATTLPGVTAIIASNLNSTIIPQPVSLGSFRLASPDASQRVLVADTTICLTFSTPSQTNAATYNWTNISGGSRFPYRTSHMSTRTNLPAGGNLGMLDGHAEWRRFSDMLPRGGSGSSTPVFWW
jgi:type II secretory pathway pseudopilin PulG